MLGFVGIVVINNAVVNTVQIVEEIEKGKKYMVKFMNTPSFHRVCTIEEISGWLLFPEEKELNTWIQSQAGAPSVGKGDGKTTAKKPEGKRGGTRKRSPAKPKDQ